MSLGAGRKAAPPTDWVYVAFFLAATSAVRGWSPELFLIENSSRLCLEDNSRPCFSKRQGPECLLVPISPDRSFAWDIVPIKSTTSLGSRVGRGRCEGGFSLGEERGTEFAKDSRARERALCGAPRRGLLPVGTCHEWSMGDTWRRTDQSL